jgi:hypothetical protein
MYHYTLYTLGTVSSSVNIHIILDLKLYRRMLFNMASENVS